MSPELAFCFATVTHRQTSFFKDMEGFLFPQQLNKMLWTDSRILLRLAIDRQSYLAPFGLGKLNSPPIWDDAENIWEMLSVRYYRNLKYNG